MQQDIANGKKPVKVTRIAVPKPHHVLANHLRDQILRGQIPAGESLPSERDLVEQTGLSRGAVREALRTLAIEGFVQTRHGRTGGSIVTLPGDDSMAAAIGRYVRGRRISLRSLQETRELVEPYLARLAALRRTSEDVEELKRIHEELVLATPNFQEFTLVNVKWHHAVARASGNDLLAILLYSISHGVEVATMAEEYDTMETRRQVITVHARITYAIEAGDPDQAERSMRQHMSATGATPLAFPDKEVLLTQGNTKKAHKDAVRSRRPRSDD